MGEWWCRSHAVCLGIRRRENAVCLGVGRGESVECVVRMGEWWCWSHAVCLGIGRGESCVGRCVVVQMLCSGMPHRISGAMVHESNKPTHL